jgi:hypothetical protein
MGQSQSSKKEVGPLDRRESREWLNKAIIQCRTIKLVRHGVKKWLNRAAFWNRFIDLNFVLAGFFALRSSSACSGIRASEFKTN